VVNLDLIKLILKIAIIGVVYIIIVFALRIMYKDIKNGGKKKVKKNPLGLEIINPGKNSNLKMGSVIPIQNGITIGRKEDNMVILNDEYVSSHHAKIYKNIDYYLEDINSTNGTFLNSDKVTGKTILKKGDIIEIGTSEFKVIG
jgi:pSer/pThr/pTyr-binding forkhead associated (FHA) protein